MIIELVLFASLHKAFYDSVFCIVHQKLPQGIFFSPLLFDNPLITDPQPRPKGWSSTHYYFLWGQENNLEAYIVFVLVLFVWGAMTYNGYILD